MVLFIKTLLLSEEVKYLGVFLVKNVLYNKHVEAKIKRVLTAYELYRWTLASTWGLTPHVVMCIFRNRCREHVILRIFKCITQAAPGRIFSQHLFLISIHSVNWSASTSLASSIDSAWKLVHIFRKSPKIQLPTKLFFTEVTDLLFPPAPCAALTCCHPIMQLTSKHVHTKSLSMTSF